MLTMTKNEYQEYLKANASKIHTKGNGYTIDDYYEDAKNVKLLPFDLEGYKLPEGMVKTINAYFYEDYLQDGHKELRGSDPYDKDVHVLVKELGMKEGDGGHYSGFLHNDELLMIFSYCEGDLYLELYKDPEAYEQAKEDKYKFYAEQKWI